MWEGGEAGRLCRAASQHLAEEGDFGGRGGRQHALLRKRLVLMMGGGQSSDRPGSDGGLLASLMPPAGEWGSVDADDCGLGGGGIGATEAALGAVAEFESSLKECSTYFADNVALIESPHPWEAPAGGGVAHRVEVPKCGGHALFDQRSSLPAGARLHLYRWGKRLDDPVGRRSQNVCCAQRVHLELRR